jgi:hypothetical protein
MYRVKLKRKIGRFLSKLEVVSHAQKRNDFFFKWEESWARLSQNRKTTT